jgi:hypothetical protein
LLIVLLAEIGLGIFVAVYSNRFKSMIVPTLKESLKNEYYGDMQNRTIVSIAWDAVMYNVSWICLNNVFLKVTFLKFECCGVRNSSDFDQIGNVWTDRNNSLVPKACCVVRNTEFF